MDQKKYEPNLEKAIRYYKSQEPNEFCGTFKETKEHFFSALLTPFVITRLAHSVVGRESWWIVQEFYRGMKFISSRHSFLYANKNDALSDLNQNTVNFTKWIECQEEPYESTYAKFSDKSFVDSIYEMWDLSPIRAEL